jgi:hypothetical protein
MFINICWKKQDGEIKKVLQPINKASRFIQEMENQGIKTWFELEQIV